MDCIHIPPDRVNIKEEIMLILKYLINKSTSMDYQKLGEDIYIPKRNISALKDSENIKFHYYLDSRFNGQWIDLDVTSKLFDHEKLYVRKSCYRVKLGQIENCVKANIIDHMKSLGLPSKGIPKALYSRSTTNQSLRTKTNITFSD